MKIHVSVIVTTYNWPSALNLVLKSLLNQTYPHFEIIVADDGSAQQTCTLIQNLQQQSKKVIQHCWQPDEGFKAAQIRNKAVAMARYPYLIFIDGDCIAPYDFIEKHVSLAEKNYFVAGNRILLNEHFSHEIIAQELNLMNFSLLKWIKLSWQKKVNRLFPLIKLPLGKLRKAYPLQWKGVKTCNLAIWRDDFIRVNGFDENFVGWGFEDSDLVIRLQYQKIYHKNGKYKMPVFHLWHKENTRDSIDHNHALLNDTLKNPNRPIKGIEQYLT